MPINRAIRLGVIAAVCLLQGAVGNLPLFGAEYFDLRLDNALISKSAKTRDWVRSPRLRFTLVDGQAVMPVIELKRGWVVPSWKGVVDSIDVERGVGNNLAGTVKARVHSSIGISSDYEFRFDIQQHGNEVRGSFTSLPGSSDPIEGNVSGTIAVVPVLKLDVDNSVWTVQLVSALPKEETLTVYLNRINGRFTSAFAFSPNVTRRPIEIDASNLSFSNSKLVGAITATRLNSREPDGGQRTTFGQYEVTSKVDSGQLRGTHNGATLDGIAVHGEVWGEIRPREPVSETPQIWLKLEDGYAGGAMWQNRVFFKAALNDEGGLHEGSAYNNKGVFEADLTGTEVKLTEDRISGVLFSTVHKSASIHSGDYSFRIDGQRAGDVFYGRFYTNYDGKEDHSGYFVGGINSRAE